MKRNEWGDAYYDEGDVMFWVLASPDGAYDEEDETRALASPADGEGEK